MKFDITFPEYKNFKNVCRDCNRIATENHITNGGTLLFTDLVYESDLIIYAIKDNEIVGFNSLVYNRGDLYIYQYAVKDEFKHIGIGSTLITLAKEYCKIFDIPNLTANAMNFNVNSDKCLQKCGLKKLTDKENNLYVCEIEPKKEKQKIKE